MSGSFTFSAELWRWQSNDGTAWIFVTLPTDVADEVDDVSAMPGGFGSVKVNVEVGDTRRSTSLFPDKSSGSFVFPIKKAVRFAQKVDEGDTAEFTRSKSSTLRQGTADDGSEAVWTNTTPISTIANPTSLSGLIDCTVSPNIPSRSASVDIANCPATT